MKIDHTKALSSIDVSKLTEGVRISIDLATKVGIEAEAFDPADPKWKPLLTDIANAVSAQNMSPQDAAYIWALGIATKEKLRQRGRHVPSQAQIELRNGGKKNYVLDRFVERIDDMIKAADQAKEQGKA